VLAVPKEGRRGREQLQCSHIALHNARAFPHCNITIVIKVPRGPQL